MNAPPWHREAWDSLRARRQRSAMPHALLLSGAAGLGKRAFADRLVRALLCTQAVDGEACGHCRSCTLLAAGTHPDRITLTLEPRDPRKPDELRKEIVIAQVRALSARLAMASQFGGWQVASIDPADALNPNAANALLKTLEEPTPSSLIVLVADAPWRLPATIRSRCQRMEFRLPPRDDALAWLRAAGVADAGVALDAAGGNPGLARAWMADDALGQRDEVRADLAALAGGRADAGTVMRRWNDTALGQRLWFAAQAAADECRARATGTRSPLGATLDAEALGHWYAHANRAREALRGPLRADLLVLELLAQWH